MLFIAIVCFIIAIICLVIVVVSSKARKEAVKIQQEQAEMDKKREEERQERQAAIDAKIAEIKARPEYDDLVGEHESDVFHLINRSQKDELFECKRYENIADCAEGTKANLDKVSTTGRICVSNALYGGELGELNAKDSKKLLEKADTVEHVYAYVINTDFDDHDHAIADVEVFYIGKN